MFRSSLVFEVLEKFELSLGIAAVKMELEGWGRVEEEIAFFVCRKSWIWQCIILVRTSPWGSTRISCLPRTEIGV